MSFVRVPRLRASLRAIISSVVYFYPVFFLLLAWEALAKSGRISRLLWPSLESVWFEFWRLASRGDLLFHGSITLQRAVSGLLLAIVIGVPLGTALARIKAFSKLVEPFFAFTYPIPKISLYPVFIFVFGFGDLSKIVLVFLECLYPIAVQTAFGMRSADRVLVWAAQNAGASTNRLFWRVLVPSAAPAIFAGIRIAVPVSLIVTIITELIGESRGLGYLVAFSSASYEPARAMAAFALIAIIGFTFDRSFMWLRQHVVFWQREAPQI